MADNTDDFSAFVVDDQQPEEEAWDVQKALEDTQKACEATSKKCSVLHRDMKSINENLSSLNNKLFVFMTNSGEIESDVRNKMDSFTDDVEKARTEAEKARESMSDMRGTAKDIQEEYNKLPRLSDYMNKTRVYLGETVKSYEKSLHAIDRINRESHHESMIVVLEWTGVVLLIVLLILGLIFLMPSVLRHLATFIDAHTATMVITYIVGIGCIFFAGYCIDKKLSK